MTDEERIKEAVKIIHDYCVNRVCTDCVLSNPITGCMIDDSPDLWDAFRIYRNRFESEEE